MISNTVLRAMSFVAAVQLSACSPGGSNSNIGDPGGSAPATVTNERVSQVPGSTGVYRPPTGGNGVRTSPIVPGRAARVFIFAGVDASCQPLPVPDVVVTKAPAKGDVTLKPGQETKLAASVGGTCLGAKATGTGVYYTARPGSSGSDSFTVTATLGSGESMTRDFTVEIAE